MEVEKCTEEEAAEYNRLSEALEEYWRDPDQDNSKYLSIVQGIVNFVSGKRHVWCKFPNITSEVLVLFTRQNMEEVNAVKTLSVSLFTDLNTCIRCIDKFHYGKRTLREKTISRCSNRDTLDEIFENVIALNIKRIGDHLGSYVPVHEKVLPENYGVLAPPLYEVFKYNEVYEYKDELIEEHLCSVITMNVIKSEPLVRLWKAEVLPGLYYYMLFHPKTKIIPKLSFLIENYVVKDGDKRRLFGNTDYDKLKPIISQAAELMNSDDYRVLTKKRCIEYIGVKYFDPQILQSRLIEDNITFFTNLSKLIVGQDRVTFPPAIKLVTLVLGIYGSDFWTLAKADPMYMITPIIKEGKNVAARTEQELVVRPMYLAAVVKSLISRVDVNKQVLRKCIEDSASFLLMSRDKFSHDCAYEFIGEYLLNCEERDPLAKDLLYRFSHIISNDAKLIEKKESLYTIFMYGTMWSVNVVKEAYRTGASANEARFMWSFISLSIRDNKYITDGLIMPIMFSNSELWYFPHTSKAVNDFKGVIAGWFANLKGCTKEAVKTEKIAKFLFPILVLPKADPVHVAFNKFLTSNSITTSPLTFIKEVINDLPEAFFDGVNNVMEKIAEIGVDNCMEYWETILLWLNNVLMALTNDSAFEYVDTAAEIFWPIVKDIIVLTHERMDKLDKSFLFSIMCNLLEFITNFATKYQTVLEGLILNEKIVCKRCKDSECTIDFYYPDINKLCKCGHKYLTHYKHQHWMFELARLTEKKMEESVLSKRSVDMIISLLKCFSLLGIGLPNPFRYLTKKIYTKKFPGYEEAFNLLKTFDKDKVRQKEEEDAREAERRAAEEKKDEERRRKALAMKEAERKLKEEEEEKKRRLAATATASVSKPPTSLASSADRKSGKFFYEDDEDGSLDMLADLAIESERTREKARAEAFTKRALMATIVSTKAQKKDLAPKFHVGTPEEIMKQLTREVLSWEYYDEECYKEKLSVIPTSFENPKHYIEVFRPLLLKEVDAQIQQSKLELEDVDLINVVRRDISNRGDYIICTFSFEDTERAHELRSLLSDNELVLIQERKEDLLAPHMLGIVDKLWMRDNTADGDISVRMYMSPKDRNAQAFRGALDRDPHRWGLKKVIDLNTSSREWSALMSSPDFFLADSLFSPFSHKASDKDLVQAKARTRAVLAPMFGAPAFAASFNKAQTEAMLYAVSGEGFRLIQGPPGTGKTKTVLGVLSALLAQVAPPGSGLSSSTAQENKRHVLVCAPSNAAVDELALRIYKNGLWDKNGNVYHPSIVRVGMSKSADPDMKKISFDHSLEEKMASDKEWNRMQALFASCVTTLANYRKQLDEASALIHELHPEFEAAKICGFGSPEYSELSAQMTALHNKKDSLRAAIDKYKTLSGKRQGMQEKQRRSLQAAVISESTIVCCTLSTAGSDLMKMVKHGFETVLIDEAAQAVEVSTLIPLRYQVRRCIMVGDTAQLPATVISKAAANCFYEQSLFQRLEKTNHHSEMLDTQYRMHPSISEFSSVHFYSRKLLPGPNVLSTAYKKPFHAMRVFAPFVFFDLRWTQEKRDQSKSTMNVQEAAFCKDLVAAFNRAFPDLFKALSVGVISPYSRQVKELDTVMKRGGCCAHKNLEISTVDAFQGREKDVVVFSCVRAPVGKTIGFLADVRRMNVAITRAKYALWIAGNSELLKTNPIWKDLIEYTKSLGSYFDVPRDIANFFGTELKDIVKKPVAKASGLKVKPPPPPVPLTTTTATATTVPTVQLQHEGFLPPPPTVTVTAVKKATIAEKEPTEPKFKKPKLSNSEQRSTSTSRSQSPRPTSTSRSQSPRLTGSSGEYSDDESSHRSNDDHGHHHSHSHHYHHKHHHHHHHHK